MNLLLIRNIWSVVEGKIDIFKKIFTSSRKHANAWFLNDV